MSCGRGQTDRQSNDEKSRREEMLARIRNHDHKIPYLGVRACLLKDSAETENINTGSDCGGCHTDGVVVSYGSASRLYLT